METTALLTRPLASPDRAGASGRITPRQNFRALNLLPVVTPQRSPNAGSRSVLGVACAALIRTVSADSAQVACANFASPHHTSGNAGDAPAEAISAPLGSRSHAHRDNDHKGNSPENGIRRKLTCGSIQARSASCLPYDHLASSGCAIHNALTFFQGCRRACQRAIAPLGQPGDRDIRLPGHQFQRLAAQQSRHDRHLSLNGKALRAIPINAHHHSSWVTLRLRCNLPQPGVSIIRAAPHR